MRGRVRTRARLRALHMIIRAGAKSENRRGRRGSILFLKKGRRKRGPDTLWAIYIYTRTCIYARFTVARIIAREQGISFFEQKEKLIVVGECVLMSGRGLLCLPVAHAASSYARITVRSRDTWRNSFFFKFNVSLIWRLRARWCDTAKCSGGNRN